MMVTALRDGMNLVAHEFVHLPVGARVARTLARSRCSCRSSPAPRRCFRAHCSSTRGTSDGVVEQLATALELTPRERQRRLETMAKRVEDLDTRRWAEGFLTRLGRYSRRDRRSKRPPTVDDAIQERIARRFARARQRVDRARLRRDAARVRAASRPRAADARDPGSCSARSPTLPTPTCTSSADDGARNLEQWFGRLPIHLSAEHGYLARAPGEEWRTLVDLDLSWLRPIERLLRRVAADVPGAHVERKSCSVAWHYRQAEPEYGSWRARELLNDLHQHLAGAPAEILAGHQVVEVRALGVDKGVYVRSLFPTGRSRPTSCSGSATTARTTISSTRCRRDRWPGTSAASSRASTARTAGARTSTSSARARCARSCAAWWRAS